MTRLSLNRTLSGKHVVLTGVTGFVGKVLLGMLLERLPGIERIYVLIRKKGLRPASKRLEKIFGSSPVFERLHEKHGAELGRIVGQRVEVLEGDLGEPDFGLDEETLARLRADIDVIINCAGLVDFNPDIRDAIHSNVDGAINVARFVKSCDKAALVHVSTVYVAGVREGEHDETPKPDYVPRDDVGFHLPSELEAAQAAVDEALATLDAPEEAESIREEALERIRSRSLNEDNPTLVRNMGDRVRREREKRVMVRLGKARAKRLGWPNTYTYTKSMGESALLRELDGSGVRWAIARPAIVESSISYPFPGWNEGFNTSGPIVYLLGTWFRHLPCRVGNSFDVVPVDMVCNGLLIAAAATVAGVHRPIYHISSSDTNPFTIERAVELTGLGYRQHYRRTGKSSWQRLVMSRLDSVPAEGRHLMSTSNLRGAARAVSRLIGGINGSMPKALKAKATDLEAAARGADKQLKGIEKMLSLFMPFIRDNHYVFRTDGLQAIEVEEQELRFAPGDIDWLTYWVDIHMPGLRRWTFPHYEGKPVPTYQPATPFRLQGPETQAAARSRGA